jgi:restriction endonuclease Mrr
MTFVEAAVAVLEREGRPMASRAIAEKAVDLGILSHVGKTPVQTMSARLSAALAKGNKKGPFVRTGRGVFALAKWQGKPPGPSKAVDQNPPRKPEVEKPSKTAAPQVDQPKASTKGERDVRAEQSFADKGSLSKKRKRKKRKTGPPEAEPEVISPTETALEAVAKPEGGPVSPVPRQPMLNQGEGAEDLTDRVASLLGRNNKPVPTAELARELELVGPGCEMLLDALLAADGFDRESRGQRSRFIKHKNGYRLLEREISAEIVSLEQQAIDARQRLVRIAERQLLRKLRGLSMSAFARVMITFLHRSGFDSMIPVDLTVPGELHLSVQDRRHQGRFRTAVVLRRDPADFALSERAVMDLRGAIHHYDAMGGMILTTGRVLDSAISEGRIANLSPVALIDGETLARELVRLGIGIKSRQLSLPSFDEAFFNDLE